MKCSQRDIDVAAQWGERVDESVDDLDPRLLLPVVEELRMPVPVKERHLRSTAIELLEREGRWSFALQLETRHAGMRYAAWMKHCRPYASRADALRAAGRAIESWTESYRGGCPVEDPDRCTCANRLLKWAREAAFTGACMCCGFEGPERMRACRNGGTTCRRCKNGCGALRAAKAAGTCCDALAALISDATQGGDMDTTTTQVPAPPAPLNGTEPAAQGKNDNVSVLTPVDQRLVDEAAYWAGRWADTMRDAVAAMLETGQRLAALKERLPHGQFVAAVEQIGLNDRGAQRAMRAARSLLQDGRPREVVADLDSVSKAYALSELTADDLDLLESGGQVGGVGLPDLAKVPVREVVRAFRAQRDADEVVRAEERDEWRSRYDTALERIRKKDEETEDLWRQLEESRAKTREAANGADAGDDQVLFAIGACVARADIQVRRAIEGAEDLPDRIDALPRSESTRRLAEQLREVAEMMADASEGLQTKCAYLAAEDAALKPIGADE